MTTKTLLTIITETVLEDTIVDEIMQLGAVGYTIFDARGRGTHGLRSGKWNKEGNICVEVVGDAELCERIVNRLDEAYEKNYGLLMYTSTVDLKN